MNVQRRILGRLLVIRLSSIGDVVLTTPILRSIRAALPAVELHLLVKPAMAGVVRHNPHLTRLHTLAPRLADTVDALRAVGFDHVIDLQGSLRSRRIVSALGAPSSGFSKENWAKYRMVHRWLPGAPVAGVDHIVTRYAQALAPLGIALDAGGLEVHTDAAAEARADQLFAQAFSPGVRPLGIVLGATHATKRWPAAYHRALIAQIDRPVILFGGPAEAAVAAAIAEGLPVPCLNAAGTTSLLEATALLSRCAAAVTHDTGLMHIAAARQVPTLTLWGSTVPGFGMTPYRAPHVVAEVAGLSCRPCSKIGYARCPQGHFRCMRDLTPESVAAQLRATGWLE